MLLKRWSEVHASFPPVFWAVAFEGIISAVWESSQLGVISDGWEFSIELHYAATKALPSFPVPTISPGTDELCLIPCDKQRRHIERTLWFGALGRAPKVEQFNSTCFFIYFLLRRGGQHQECCGSLELSKVFHKCSLKDHPNDIQQIQYCRCSILPALCNFDQCAH